MPTTPTPTSPRPSEVHSPTFTTLNFWDHLDVLRAALLRAAVVWLVLAIALFAAMPWLFTHVVLAPCHDEFATYRLLHALASLWGEPEEAQPFHLQLINIRLTAPLMLHISTALQMSVVLCVPYLVFEVWHFVSPALYDRERRPVRRALLIGAGLFYAGVLVSYFFIFPLTLRFLSAYTLGEGISNQISLDSYVETCTALVLSVGLAFELPILTWLLSAMGIINRTLLRRYRRHAVVAVVVLAAIITPTGDPFTLTVVAIPLYLLYELGIVMTKA